MGITPVWVQIPPSALKRPQAQREFGAFVKKSDIVIEKLRESKSWQFLLIAALILILPLMVDITGRIGIIQRMHEEKIRLEQEIATKEAEHQALQEQLDFVASDTYLEQWARVDARMSLPGEVAAIPLHDEKVEKMPLTKQDRPAPGADADSISQQWHQLFFDDTTAP